MTFFRTVKRENPFVQIDKDLVNDPTISAKAKGIMLYLLSKPEGWKVYQSDIVNHMSDGKTSISNGIKELLEAGYIERNRAHNEDGTFAGYEYTVYERKDLKSADKPRHDNVSTESLFSVDGKPVNGLSDNGKSATSNIYITNNDLSNNDLSNIKQHGALNSTPPSENKKDTPQLSDVPHGKKVYLQKLCPQSKVYIYDTIIGHLNKVADKRFSPSGEANQKAINGRLDEGYTIQDILNVIDIKSQQWSHNKKMSKYLRPSTLFRKSKFEGYLNEYKEQYEVQEEVKHEADTIEQNITKRDIDVSESPF